MTEDKLMPRMNLMQLVFMYSVVKNIPWSTHRKNFDIKTNWSPQANLPQCYNELRKNVLSMIRYIGFTKIYKEGELPAKYYEEKHLKFLIIPHRMDINMELVQWSISFLIKNLEILLGTEQQFSMHFLTRYQRINK